MTNKISTIGPRLDRLAADARALSRDLAVLLDREQDMTTHGFLNRAHRIVAEFADNLDHIRSTASEGVRATLGMRP